MDPKQRYVELSVALGLTRDELATMALDHFVNSGELGRFQKLRFAPKPAPEQTFQPTEKHLWHENPDWIHPNYEKITTRILEHVGWNLQANNIGNYRRVIETALYYERELQLPLASAALFDTDMLSNEPRDRRKDRFQTYLSTLSSSKGTHDAVFTVVTLSENEETEHIRNRLLAYGTKRMSVVYCLRSVLEKIFQP